jgi:hypothetical protein
MARYTTGALGALESTNYIATIEEDYFMLSKSVKLNIRRKGAFKRTLFSHTERIPFKAIPNSALEKEQWENARRIVNQLARQKISEFEKNQIK